MYTAAILTKVSACFYKEKALALKNFFCLLHSVVSLLNASLDKSSELLLYFPFQTSSVESYHGTRSGACEGVSKHSLLACVCACVRENLQVCSRLHHTEKLEL